MYNIVRNVAKGLATFNKIHIWRATKMFCRNCGNEIDNAAPVCNKCGTRTGKGEVSACRKIAKIFMILTCILSGLLILPLAWTIPMTINGCRKIKNGERFTVGYMVCTLLFFSPFSAILLIIDNDLIYNK